MPNYHVADIIARIKNALRRRKSSVTLPNTQFVYAFMTCLVNEGYIEKFSTSNIGVEPLGEGSSKVFSLNVGTNSFRGIGLEAEISDQKRTELTLEQISKRSTNQPSEMTSINLPDSGLKTFITMTFATAQGGKKLPISKDLKLSSQSSFDSGLSLPVTENKFERSLPVLTSLVCVSRPGTRVYVKKSKITPVLGGLGTHILSTSKGLMTSRQAIKLNLGGELLCTLW